MLKTSHWPLLDWLRFFAALLVVLDHARQFTFGSYQDLDPHAKGTVAAVLIFATMRFGKHGVLIFFVLSGYLVGGLATKRFLEGRFDPRGYALDRAARIFVPLIPAIALCSVLQIWLGIPIRFQDPVSAMLGLPTGALLSDVPLWSLRYEMWFYVFHGAVLSLLLPSRGVRIIAFGFLMASLVAFSFLALQYLFCWYLGVLSFLTNTGLASRRSGFAGAAIALAFLTMSQAFARSSFLGPMTILGATGFSAGCLLLLPQLANRDLSSPRLVRLGGGLAAFSYSLYLIHYPVLLVLGRYLPPVHRIDFANCALLAGRVAIAMLAGYVFYLAFETHIGRVRSWLRSGWHRTERVETAS
ncbi:MAG: acyltransferase [Rhizomicrobium sp.]